MTLKGSRIASLLALLLMMLPSLLAPTALAYHAGRGEADTSGPESEVDDVPIPDVRLPFGIEPTEMLPVDSIPVPDVDPDHLEDQTDTYPFLDQQRDDLLQRQRDAVALLEQELARRNLAAAQNVPVLTGRVLEDHVDAGTRIGGVGPWRVHGAGWRIAQGAGPNGTAAFTMTDPETGKYGTMDSWLVSPALDLSGYVLQTGTLPYGGGGTGDLPYVGKNVGDVDLTPNCMGNGLCDVLPHGSSFLNDQINLLFRHRYNLGGEDGGQVLVFDKDPTKGGIGRVITPMNLYGHYSSQPVAGLDGSRGFSGYSGWNLTAFDLTPWAGKVVWIVFRIGTGDRAGSDPAYFKPGAMRGPEPYGWTIDDVEVYAPAWGRNLKVFSIDGPSFRINASDTEDRVVPGSVVPVGATVINAGAYRTLATLNVTVTTSSAGDVRHGFTRELEPGEVWNVTVNATAPPEDETLTVKANVSSAPVYGGVRLPEGGKDDNALDRTWIATYVSQFTATLDVGASMVDDNAAQSAVATIVNTGNMPLHLDLDLWERWNATNQTTGARDIPRALTHERRALDVAPGERKSAPWSVTTGDRGAHALQLNASAVGIPTQLVSMTYYVHASPAPVFAAGGEDGLPPGWDMYLATGPIDPDGGSAWMTKGVSMSKTLRATPLPEVVAGADGPNAKYTDLKLRVRYFGLYSATISINYPTPATVPTPIGDPASSPVWSTVLPGPPRRAIDAPWPVAHFTNRTWATYETDVIVNESQGYWDLWSVNGLELHVLVQPPGSPAFYLDDLRLTGVPAGKDEAFRRDIVRITGDDSPANVDGTANDAGVSQQTTVGPAQPAFCDQGQGVMDISDFGNCWKRVNATQLRESAKATRWAQSSAVTPSGVPILFRYEGNGKQTAQSWADRLVTPNITLTDATDPLVFLDHAYAFQGEPKDEVSPTSLSYQHQLHQIGILEAQYRQDDGTWSPFRRLVPEGGYPKTLETTQEGFQRKRGTTGDYMPGNGFFHPVACKVYFGDKCDNGGYYRNIVEGLYRWIQYNPTPYPEVSVVSLNAAFPGVNLTDRVIRLGLQATESSPAFDGQKPAEWLVYGLRVTPVSRFAIDASVSNLTLDTAYDWRALGVAPGTTVAVNVTVRNDGLFSEDFSVRLDVGDLGSGYERGNYTRVGALAPGESRYAILPWNVSGTPGRSYNITVVVAPTDNRTKDENRFNDRVTLGADGSLRAAAVRDLGLTIQAFPARGDVGLTRYVPVTLYNRGNVEIGDVTVERVIEYLGSDSTQEVDRHVYALSKPLGPTPGGVPLTLASSSVRESDLSFIPNQYGTYLVTLRVKVAGVNLAGDAVPVDNEARAFLEAVEPLYADGFDDRFGWHTDQPDVWGEGPGFRSQSSLTAMNRTTGLIPPGTDASAVSPRIDLSNARTAIVNLLAKYDLEKGYDGAVLEISTDNQTWTRVGPLDDLQRPGPYPGVITSSNPLAAGAPLDQNVTAFTGSSADLTAQLDGWAPVSFDLSTVPGVGELVTFRPLDAPRQTSPIPAEDRVSYAGWMVLEPGNEDARWEVRNEQYSKDVKPDGKPLMRWWSGVLDKAETRSLKRAFDLNGTDPVSTALAVTWWDRRPGTRGSNWDGVGGDYDLRANVTGSPYDFAPKPEVIGQDGDWYRLRVVLEPNMSRTLGMTLHFDSVKAAAQGTMTPIRSATDVGWEVRDVRFEVYPANRGNLIPGALPLANLAGDENDPAVRDLWAGPSKCRKDANGKFIDPLQWCWVDERTPRPAAPWDSVQQKGPDGRTRDMWKLTLNATTRSNVDTRLVAPVVDLAEVGGGRTFLRLTHSFDLLCIENRMERGSKLSDNKYYQAGTVEVEVFNRTTYSWDPPKQLFADPVGPVKALRDGATQKCSPAADGAPYNVQLKDAGDTFQRYPRTHLQPIGAQDTYYRKETIPTAYAFAGQSASVPGNQGGWLTQDFDLSAYRGEKVRVVFHAWSSPTDPEVKDRHWTIASADVIGNVLSASDVYLRLRLGTDSSILGGVFSVDQVEISGRRYDHSIGLSLDETPRAIATADGGGSAIVSGAIQNYGPGARYGVAVGVEIIGPTGAVLPYVVPTKDTFNVSGGIPGYVAAAGPYDLDAAGGEHARVPFAFRLFGPAQAGVYTVRLVVLDQEHGAYAPVDDDVPGRARRQWDLAVEDTYAVKLDEKPLTLTPPALSSPGDVVAKISGVNTGTREVTVSATFTWRTDGGATHSQQAVPAPGAPAVKVKPGQAFALEAPPVRFAEPGNYTLSVAVLNASKAFAVPVSAQIPYRVGRTDVVYAESFDQGFAGWTGSASPPGSPQFRIGRDESYFGNGSILYGYTDDEYEMGLRLAFTTADNQPITARLTSPTIDLRSARPDTTLGFWQKSRLDATSILHIEAQRVTAAGSPDPACGPVLLTPQPFVSLVRRQAEWTYVRVPLTGAGACSLLGAFVQISFVVDRARDQSWRMDGLTLAGGDLRITPPARAHGISDGASKDYVFSVTNGGAATREVRPALDLNQSRLTPEQAKWVVATPERLVLEPGATGTFTVRVDTPAARGLFPQPVNVSIALRDAQRPFRTDLARIDLDFRPEPRADLAVAASADGRPLGELRVGVEEGTPHEIGVLVSNLGLDASRPTDVVLRIANASGGIVWEHRERIDGIPPVSEGGEALLVAATWKPPFGKRGNHTLLVSVDPDRRQVDYDRSNSEVSLPLAVTPLVRPDLVVDARSMKTSTPSGVRIHEAVPGQLVRISGVVRNDGLADAKQVTVRIVAGSAVLKEDVLPVLKVGDSYLASTNQIAPPNTTSYQIVALTPDVEIAPDNNAQVLELPILPPELVVSIPEAELRVEPGAHATVPLNVTNNAPYPTVVNLTMGEGARFATLATERLALGPGETRGFTLRLDPAARELAGTAQVVVLVESSEGLRTRRTLDVEVEARPAASTLAYLARGPPQAVRVEFDAVNTGNVELRPQAVVRSAAGEVLLRQDLPALAPGKARFASALLKLPDATPPGQLGATLAIEAGGQKLSEAPLTLDVDRWGRLLARATPGPAVDGQQVVGITVAYEGNAPTVRQPVLLNVPQGVVARYSVDALTLDPGETANLTLRIATPRATPNGLYMLQAGFADPDGETTLLGNLTGIPLDLRRAKAELVSARRVAAEVPTSGDVVEYVAKVRNVGDRDAAAIPVDLYVDGALVSRSLVERLAPGEVRDVRLTYNAGSGRHAVVLAVDPHGPDADEALAFAETLEVQEGVVEGVPGLSQVPGPAPFLLVAVAAAVAVLLRRRGGPK